MMVIAEMALSAIVPEFVLHMCGRIYAEQTTRTVGPWPLVALEERLDVPSCSLPRTQ
jgi:hypothetical protein